MNQLKTSKPTQEELNLKSDKVHFKDFDNGQ